MLTQTVFIVDDDASIRNSLSYSLRKRNFQVQTFDSAQSYLDQYKTDDTGCLILDLRMQGMDGLALQAELIKRNASLPVIFISGHGGIAESVKAIKSGALDFLEKPFRPLELVYKIKEAFAIDQQRQIDHSEQIELGYRFRSLSKREWEVLEFLTNKTASYSNKQIARELGISHRTVDQHRAKIMSKTDCTTLLELIRLFEQIK